MFHLTNCIIHEEIYASIIFVSLIYIAFVIISLWSFSISNKDIISFVILFLVLCILGGRFLLLGAGLADKLYDESQCYANVLIDEKDNLISTFPFIQKVEDTNNDLRRMEAKNIPLKIYCNQEITEKQCEQVETFIMDKIGAMGGGPYTDLQLSIFAPPHSETGDMHTVFAQNITLDTQKKVYDFKRWVIKNITPDRWLGALSLLMLAYLQGLSIFYLCFAQKSHNIRFILPFAIISLIVFGGFYVVHNFYHPIIYCHILGFSVASYALLCVGCWVTRFHYQKRQAYLYINLLTQFFTLVSLLLFLFLLFAG